MGLPFFLCFNCILRAEALDDKVFLTRYCVLEGDSPLFLWQHRRKEKAWQKEDAVNAAALQCLTLHRLAGDFAVATATKATRLGRRRLLKKAGENFLETSPWGLSVV
jgi:hypothetical protein